MKKKGAAPGLKLAVLAIILCLVIPPVASAASNPNGNVSARVIQDAARDGWADFIIVLANQANVSLAAQSSPDSLEQANQVYLSLRSTANSSQSDVIQELKHWGATYQTFWIANLVAVRGPLPLIDELAKRPDVAYIASNASFRVPLENTLTSLPASTGAMGIEWNLNWVKAPSVWGLGDTGQGIVYANADTGVQWDHPALKNQYRGWDGSKADHNYNWWDAIQSDISSFGNNPCGYALTAPCDDYGHGTHTMGIGVGSTDGTNQIGMAPGAKWIACRNMDQGVGRPSTYLSCFQFFLAPTDLNGNNPNPSKRPDVISNSYACPTSEQCLDPHVFQTTLESLRAAGIFFSVSAGNSGPSCGSINTPPALEESGFTVGGTGLGYGSNTNQINPISSRGPVTVDGSVWRKPDLVAPGFNVYSSIPGNLYGVLGGTSMAAPHVAGAVALLWSAYPGLRHNVAQTETLLEQSAVHLATTDGCGSNGPTTMPNNTYGYGELDVWSAYLLAGNIHLDYSYFPAVFK